MELSFGPTTVSESHITGLPLSGAITSRFAERDIAEHAGGHSGVDIGAAIGTPVRAPAAGRVLEATPSASVFGTYVTMRHAAGFVSLFAHLSRLDVAPGQRLRAGDTIGLVGMTGLTTGPHLHWGLALGGSPLVAGPHLRDPLARCSPSPQQIDDERVWLAVGLSLAGALQAAGALLGTHTEDDFAGYEEGSREQAVLLIQRLANPLIAHALELIER